MSLFKSTFMVAAMTMISRVLGLVREMVFTSHFGASAGMDAFLVAFKIPNFFRRLFAEGAFTQAFVPVLSTSKTQSKHERMRLLIQRTMGTLAVCVLIVSLIGMLGSALWVMIFAPGFLQNPDKYHLSVNLLRITFPYLFFISLTALCGAVLNTYGKFAIAAITPVFLNIALIVAALFAAPYFTHPVTALAWGLLAAGLIQFIFQLPFLHRLGLLSWPKWGWRDSQVRRVMVLMVPVLFGASVTQLSLLIDTLFASFLPTGSVSWLYYSDRLIQFPLGVFGVALSTVVLPHLSARHVTQNQQGYQDTLDWALRLVVLVGVPAAVGMILIGGPLLSTLFGYGRFNSFDIAMARESLTAFALGLVFFILLKVVVAAFYARQDMRTPVKAALWAVGVNIIFNLILIKPFAHAGVAMATSISSAFDVVVLLVVLQRCGLWRLTPAWRRIVIAVVLSSTMMALVLGFGMARTATWLTWHGGERVLHLILWIVIAKVIYFGCLRLAGVRKRDWLYHE